MGSAHRHDDLIINIPIIIISYKVVGRKFLLKSFKTMVISTLFLDLVFPLTPLYTGNSFLAAIFPVCLWAQVWR